MNIQADFVFDQSNKTYYPGEVVSGTVIVLPLRSFTAYRVEVNLKCVNTKIPFNEESNMVDSLIVGEQLEMVLGESYRFPFSFDIPNASPETYNGKHFNLRWAVELSTALDRKIQKLGAKIEKNKEEIVIKSNPAATQRSILLNEISTDLTFNYQIKKYPQTLYGIGVIAFLGIPFVGFILDIMLFGMTNSRLSMLCFFAPSLIGFMTMVSIVVFNELILNKIETVSMEAIDEQYEELKLTFQDQPANFNQLSFFVDVIPKFKLINLKRIESTLTLKEQVGGQIDTRTSTAYLQSKRWKTPTAEILTAGVPWSKEINLDLDEFNVPDTFRLGGNALKWELAVKLVTDRRNPIIIADLNAKTLVPELIEDKIKNKLARLPKDD